MIIHIISFTENGIRLSERISREKISFRGEKVDFYPRSTCSLYDYKKSKVDFLENGLKDYVKSCFKNGEPIMFIGACGIAVRLIAPCIKNKLNDIPVLVIDEKGEYVIPVLSGHVGGANELAVIISEKLGAKPVITTATDINNTFAADIFAKKNDLYIENKNGIAAVSSKLLSGESITIKISTDIKISSLPSYDNVMIISGKSDEKPDILISSDTKDKNGTLILRPRPYILGIGCKKGKSADEIEGFAKEVLKKKKIPLKYLSCIASIDLKKDEEGIKALSKKLKIPFHTYSSDELNSVKGDFSSSEFVKNKTGVDNVCERASVCACKEGGMLLIPKCGKKGMTVAVSKKNVSVSFD